LPLKVILTNITDFKIQHQPAEFFRSGQVFSLCISANLLIHHRSRCIHRHVEISQLPLEPITTLKAKFEQSQKTNREARLKEILSLPLAQMIRYTKAGRNKKVACTLCPNAHQSIAPEFDKDNWADEHFRCCHWKRYCTMRGISPDSKELPLVASYLKPEPKQLITQPTSTNLLHAVPTDWITLEDIQSDEPIYEDWEIREMVCFSSQAHEPGIPGPIMIRRFVVIQEGLESCLCLGIHT
jgi:hypothetical protein